MSISSVVNSFISILPLGTTEESYRFLQSQKQKKPSSLSETIIAIGEIFRACIEKYSKDYLFAFNARKISQEFLQKSVQKASYIFRSEEPAYHRFYIACNQLISILLSFPKQSPQDMVENLSETIRAVLENRAFPDPISLERWQSFISTTIQDVNHHFQNEPSRPFISSSQKKLENLPLLQNTQDASPSIECIQKITLDTMVQIQAQVENVE